MELNLVNLESDYKQSRCESKRIIERILALKELVRLKSDHCSYKDWMYRKIAIQFKVSARTLYRWKSGYERLGLFGVRPRLAPGRKKKAIAGWVARYIKTMRDDYNWGSEVIQAHLREDYGIELSEYKIHRFLKDRGYLNRKVRKIKSKKHFKTVHILVPGVHTQLDVKHLPRILKSGRKCYVYNFVDHASRWQFKMVFESYGAWETYRFMQALLDTCPFPIKRLQTDHGIEFTYKFLHHVQEATEHPLEHICKLHGIRKKLIPVGEKEQNGLVERSHRQDDNELYETIRPLNIQHFNLILKKHVNWLNQCRRRKPLNWKTANEYLLDFRKQLNSTEKGNDELNKITSDKKAA